MYAPSDDTFLLADCIAQYRGRRALEIGVGSGFLLKKLEENFESVAGSDIDLQALQHCKSQSNNVLLVCCDAASAFAGKFDLIVSNPPYLPDDDDDKVRDSTVHGGPAGIEATVRFVQSAMPLLDKEGAMLIVVSSLADTSALDRLAKKEKMKRRVVKEKRMFYETLSVVELGRR